MWTASHHEVNDRGIGILDFYRSDAEHAHPHQNDHADECAGVSDEDSGYISFDFSTNKPMDESALNRFLESAPWQVFRIKGPVRFHDRTVLLNFVAGQCNWDTWEGKPETRLVLVGWEIEAEKIMPDLEKCVEPD